MTGKFMLIAAASLVLTAARAANPSPTSPADKLAAAKDDPKPAAVTAKAKTNEKAVKESTEEEKAKIQELEAERLALLRKLQQKRIDLLKNNPKLHKMYLDILKQTQELAIELDSDMEIRTLNRELREIETKLKEKRK